MVKAEAGRTPPARFMLDEAAAVYPAARLICRNSDGPNPAFRAGMGKLAAVVPEDLGAVMRELAGTSKPAPATPSSQGHTVATRAR